MNYATPSEAYLATLRRLLTDPQCRVDPRRSPTSECLDYSFTVETPDDGPVVTASVTRNETMARYLAVEKSLYLSGELSADVWAERASGFWRGLANPDGTVNSNYGWLVFRDRSLPSGLTPWEWARKSLERDPSSRQAYVRFAQQRHLWRGNRDQVCTMHMMFMFRENRLHATVVMRSNDVVKGLAYDMPWFCHLLERMADELGWSVGTYTHFVHSMHLYDRDVALAKEMLG